ncbi:MAG: sulfatase [Lentisphaeraceae bacterium]|nr:sulfatase [Lentisphaeraceae bacterium]
MKLLLFTLLLTSSLPSFSQQKNILFIAVDDLKPTLGCYGTEHVISPNIDRIAKEGATFLNAYCNVPVCGASRASIMTSIRPIAGKRFMSHMSQADKEAQGILTLAGHFKNNGYTTISNGKILHMKEDSESDWSEKPWHDINYSQKNWASNNFDALWKDPKSKENLSKRGRGPYFEAADVSDDEHQDGQVALKTIEDLKKLKESGKPFFLACGFWRPHLPFNAPKKYFDMYDPTKLPMSKNSFPISKLPKGCKSSKEFYAYSKVEGRWGSKEFEREARHGYFACVTYIDAQIGRILDELDRLKLSENTIIVLWGDHGWHLGEHQFWGKHNNLDQSTRAPLIIKAPGLTKGFKLKQLAEFVDVYPTLCELTGTETPKHVQGKSLKAVLESSKAPTKDAVFIEWRNCYTIKTAKFAYTEFFDKKGKVTDFMLFDHIKDRAENTNIVHNPEYRSVVTKLRAQLHEHRASVK